jgi:hypothetical protein
MRITFILLFVFLMSSASAQVLNSLSKDTTGFYGHALDSAIAIIKENKVLRTVYVGGRECVKDYLPDTLRNVAIKWRPPGKSKRDKMKLKDDEMIVLISCLSIIRDEVTVAVYTAREGDWLYRFLYYYQPEIKEYKLMKVYKGMRL